MDVSAPPQLRVPSRSFADCCMHCLRGGVRPKNPCASYPSAQAGIPWNLNLAGRGTCCLHRGVDDHPGSPTRPRPPGIPRKPSEIFKGHSGELEHCASSVGATTPALAQVSPFFPKGPIAFLLGAKPPGRVRDRIIPGRLLVELYSKSPSTGYQPKPACFQRRFYKLRSPGKTVVGRCARL